MLRAEVREKLLTRRERGNRLSRHPALVGPLVDEVDVERVRKILSDSLRDARDRTVGRDEHAQERVADVAGAGDDLVEGSAEVDEPPARRQADLVDLGGQAGRRVDDRHRLRLIPLAEVVLER